MMGRAPNILFIQADQLPPQFLPCYGHGVVQAPNLQRLAERGVVFDSAYCNFPLCAPSRFSMLSGLLASRIGAYDNGAEFPAAVPTFAHALRLLGYETCLSGKMHFIGPDQLHGFEERLTTDIYPADFAWTADWSPRERSPTAEMAVVTEAGPCRRSVQVDFDEEACFLAVRKIFDLARDPLARPFFLTVSLTHPHDPFETPWDCWNRYRDDDIDPPVIAPDRRDPHSRRLAGHFGMDETGLDEAAVRRARRAYYGSISYVDDRLGELLAALEAGGQAENTIVVFAADHGEFLGERGLWFKRSFFEHSARVPLIVAAPQRFAPRRVTQHVSLVDLFPTLCELAGGAVPEAAAPLDGRSLVPLMEGAAADWDNVALGEILCECTSAPIFMVRRDRWKYVACETDPPQLYDLAADPQELVNLAGQSELAEIESRLAAEVATRWDARAIARAVRDSQRRRLLVNRALATGRQTAWDYQPQFDAARAYYRGHGGGDAENLIRRGLAHGIVAQDADGISYRGRPIGANDAEAAAFLRTEFEIANALERQIREAAGRL